MADELNLRVNPNQADLKELTGLPGVGKALGERIIAARPFEDMEDLLRVSGLGAATLESLRPHLDFAQEREPSEAVGEEGEEQDKQIWESEAEDAQAEDLPQETAVRRPRPSAARRAPALSPWGMLDQPLWLLLGTAAATVILSILLTLAVLGGINRTIDIGQHASVRQVGSDLADLRLEVQGIASRMDALSRRMDAIEGLSGRIQMLEDSFTGLQDDVVQAMGAVESMRSLVQDLEAQVSELSQTYARFDAFLDSLRQLLDTLPQDAQPEPTTQP